MDGESGETTEVAVVTVLVPSVYCCRRTLDAQTWRRRRTTEHSPHRRRTSSSVLPLHSNLRHERNVRTLQRTTVQPRSGEFLTVRGP